MCECTKEASVMARLFWPAVVVAVIGLFMLVAGIGPLWLPVVVLLIGAVGAVVIRNQARRTVP
jgi:UPF0716 family protein affecting phage T7 exclusion